MALFNINDLRSEARTGYLADSRYGEGMDDYASRKLNEHSETFTTLKTYDVFLSHCVKDAVAILRLVRRLESYGLSVYVDWIVDKQLDRTKVTTETARQIRKRLKSCRSLLMALTYNSVQSSWVQWELGLGDGQKNGKVAILPLMTGNDPNPNFHRQEYLGLYPYIDYAGDSIYVNGKSYVTLKDWLTYSDPLERIIYS